MSFIGDNSHFGRGRGRGRSSGGGGGGLLPSPNPVSSFQPPSSSSFPNFKPQGSVFSPPSSMKHLESSAVPKKVEPFRVLSPQPQVYSAKRAAEAPQGDFKGSRINMRMSRGGGGGGTSHGGRERPYGKEAWVANSTNTNTNVVEEDNVNRGAQPFQGRNNVPNSNVMLDNLQRGGNRRERMDEGFAQVPYGGARYRQEDGPTFPLRQTPASATSPPHPITDSTANPSASFFNVEKGSSFAETSALPQKAVASSFFTPPPPPPPPPSNSIFRPVAPLKEGHPTNPSSSALIQSSKTDSTPDSLVSFSMAARLFDGFVEKLAYAEESKREEARIELEEAFLGDAARLGIHGANFSRTVSELMIVWKRRKENFKTAEALEEVPGELWVAFYALGCQVNLMLSAVRTSDEVSVDDPQQEGCLPEPEASDVNFNFIKGIQANLALALMDACAYANQLSDLLLTVYQQQSKLRTPYAILPIVLERVRTVFDAVELFLRRDGEKRRGSKRGANAGAFSKNSTVPLGGVQSNMEMNLLKLFAIFQRKVTLVMKDGAAPGGPDDDGAHAPCKVLECRNAADRELVRSFAHMTYELLPTKLLPENFLLLVFAFMAAFHRSLPGFRWERGMLYYSHAARLLQGGLDREALAEAARWLAAALVVSPPEAPARNRRLLELRLTAVELALGRAPADEIPAPLLDAVAALRTASLARLDAAMRANGVFFVETGVYKILMVARGRVGLLMVIRFYLQACARARARSEGDRAPIDRLDIAEMVHFFRLPYRDVFEATAVWLLPLLVSRMIHGFVEEDYLHIDPESPFEGYDKALLMASLDKS